METKTCSRCGKELPITEFYPSPRWVVGENVLGIVNWSQGMVFEHVCADLEAAGYEVQSYLIPAAGVDAPHRRDRIWIVAHRADAFASDTRCIGLREWAHEQELVEGSIRPTDSRACSEDGVAVDAEGQRCYEFQFTGQSSQTQERSSSRYNGSESIPNWE